MSSFRNFKNFQEFYDRGIDLLDLLYGSHGRNIQHMYVGDGAFVTEKFHVGVNDIGHYKDTFKKFTADLFTVSREGRSPVLKFMDDMCNGYGVFDSDSFLTMMRHYSALPDCDSVRQNILDVAIRDNYENDTDVILAIDKSYDDFDEFCLNYDGLSDFITDLHYGVGGFYVNGGGFHLNGTSVGDKSTPKFNLSGSYQHFNIGADKDVGSFELGTDRVVDSVIHIDSDAKVSFVGSLYGCSLDKADVVSDICQSCVLDMGSGARFVENAKSVLLSDKRFSRDTVSGVIMDSGNDSTSILYDKLREIYNIADEDILDLAEKESKQLELEVRFGLKIPEYDDEDDDSGNFEKIKLPDLFVKEDDDEFEL